MRSTPHNHAFVRAAVRPARAALFAFLAGACLCRPAVSWEGKAARSIAGKAILSAPGKTTALLKERSSFFNEGLSENPRTVDRYAGFTVFDTTGHAAGMLADQIALLRGLFPEDPSPYMAYRLGILSKLIMELNSPFATTTAPRMGMVRDSFNRDVNAHLAEISRAPRAPRVMHSPGKEIEREIERSAGWGGPIRSQYLAGRGFNPIVRRAATKFYNEAIDSVGDTLLTVTSGGKGAVRDDDRLGYYVDACGYYLGRGMKQYARAAYLKARESASIPTSARIETIEDAIDGYERVLQVISLEERLKKSRVEIDEQVSAGMKAPFLSALSRLAKDYMARGRRDKARVALSILLRENYHPGWTRQYLKKVYGLDELENLDVPENAWKFYREANRFEAAASRQLSDGTPWAAHESFLRAAALYSVIPKSIASLNRMSRARKGQVVKKMQAIPPNALLSEELFQNAVDSLAAGDIDAAVTSLQKSKRWKPGDGEVDRALGETESLKLFARGRELYGKQDFDEGVKYFRKIKERHPQGALSAQAKEMIDLYERRKALKAGRHLLLLKGAYEALFLGSGETVYGYSDEILRATPTKDVRDRAQLLIAVAWYQAGQGGYRRIDRILRDLLENRVIEEDNGKFILKKKIDFYFGLKDPFPEIDLADLDSDLLKRLDLKAAEPTPAGPLEEAERAIEKADEEIEDTDKYISKADAKEKELDEAISMLDKAQDLLRDARDNFEGGEYDRARDDAEEAMELAVAARDEAERALGDLKDESEQLRDEKADLANEAEARIDEAEKVVKDAETDLDDAEDAIGSDLKEIRSDFEEAEDLLKEAMDLFKDEEYRESIDKAEESIEKAENVSKDAEEAREIAEQ